MASTKDVVNFDQINSAMDGADSDQRVYTVCDKSYGHPPETALEIGMGDEAPPSYAESGHVRSENTPPSYSATTPHGDMAPPPSYDSLYGRMKQAKESSDGNMDFGKKFLVILCSTIGCTIMLGVMLAIPITMIVLGAKYKDDCPAERMIPIYLIVAGSFGIVKNLSSLGQRCRNKGKEDEEEQNAKTNPFDALLNCFLFAWFIAGNVWIYRTHGEWSKDETADNFCDPTLYYFAFWITTATYILIGCTCCCMCCTGILVACCSAKAE